MLIHSSKTHSRITVNLNSNLGKQMLVQSALRSARSLFPPDSQNKKKENQ